jgi:hypothetical protein
LLKVALKYQKIKIKSIIYNVSDVNII